MTTPVRRGTATRWCVAAIVTGTVLYAAHLAASLGDWALAVVVSAAACVTPVLLYDVLTERDER